MRHCMIDLETMGLRPGCAILSLGAVIFTQRGVQRESAFYLNISLDSCLDEGLVIDPATEKWWDEQEPKARAALVSPEPVKLRVALENFSWWYNETVLAERIWSHGASTDVPWLQSAYDAVGLPEPWNYRDVRDTRTLYDLAEGYEEWSGRVDPVIEHYALDDAVAQAQTVVNAMIIVGYEE